MSKSSAKKNHQEIIYSSPKKGPDTTILVTNTHLETLEIQEKMTIISRTGSPQKSIILEAIISPETETSLKEFSILIANTTAQHSTLLLPKDQT